MEQTGESTFRDIPGLYDVLVGDDEKRKIEVLSRIQPGEKIRVAGMLLGVDKPTSEESNLMRKAQKEHREHVLIKVGDETAEIAGKRGEVDKNEVWKEAKRLLDSTPSSRTRVFSHTHYDREYTPIPSGADIPVMRQYSEGWNFTCRVVSWIPDRVFVFKGTF